jgi:hypothetical protein
MRAKMKTRGIKFFAVVTTAAISAAAGCSTIKQSDTSRTGLEQLLISSADDRALDKFDLRPIAGAKVFVDTQFLDCTDKNYLLVALHERLLNDHCTVVAKAEDSDVTLEVGSGGVGTDRDDLFFGIPEISAPVPIPITIPKVAFYERSKAMGTAKIAIVAYDTKSKLPVINTGYALARSDHKHWQVLGVGGQQSGSVQQELIAQANESPSATQRATILAQKTSGSTNR